MTKQGVVNIRGKEYKTVALRVQEFREQYPNYFLTTDIIKIDKKEDYIREIQIKELQESKHD